MASISEEGHSISWTEELAPRARLGETWWLGLRRSAGVSPEQARSTAGFQGGGDPALETALHIEEVGMLRQEGGRFALTSKGIPVADRVAAEFLWVPPDAESE